MVPPMEPAGNHDDDVPASGNVCVSPSPPPRRSLVPPRYVYLSVGNTKRPETRRDVVVAPSA